MKTMRPIAIIIGMFASTLLFGQSTEEAPKSLAALQFLEGNWEAKTAPEKGGPAVSGTYSFRKELGGHILGRHSSNDSCKGPADFDCDHNDLFYIYQDVAGQPLQAIYFDNEGHVIHYSVSVSAGSSVTFLSIASPGPRYRLHYELHAGIMSGKFQMQMPGQTDWKSYLEWNGPKK